MKTLEGTWYNKEVDKETPMKQSAVASLQALRKVWRKNNFKFTSEEQERYDTLLQIRRDQVWAWNNPE